MDCVMYTLFSMQVTSLYLLCTASEYHVFCTDKQNILQCSVVSTQNKKQGWIMRQEGS